MTLQRRVSVSPNIEIINNARRNEGCQIMNSELILFSLNTVNLLYQSALIYDDRIHRIPI